MKLKLFRRSYRRNKLAVLDGNGQIRILRCGNNDNIGVAGYKISAKFEHAVGSIRYAEGRAIESITRRIIGSVNRNASNCIHISIISHAEGDVNATCPVSFDFCRQRSSTSLVRGLDRDGCIVVTISNQRKFILRARGQTGENECGFVLYLLNGGGIAVFYLDFGKCLPPVGIETGIGAGQRDFVAVVILLRNSGRD